MRSCVSSRAVRMITGVARHGDAVGSTESHRAVAVPDRAHQSKRAFWSRSAARPSPSNPRITVLRRRLQPAQSCGHPHDQNPHGRCGRMSSRSASTSRCRGLDGRFALGANRAECSEGTGTRLRDASRAAWLVAPMRSIAVERASPIPRISLIISAPHPSRGSPSSQQSRILAASGRILISRYVPIGLQRRFTGAPAPPLPFAMRAMAKQCAVSS